MNQLNQWFAIALMIAVSSSSYAGIKDMGTNYRTLLSNYQMLYFLKKECADIAIPALVSRPEVEKMMQGKLGIEMYVQITIAIQKSDLRKNAEATVGKLVSDIESCDDPRLSRALTSIELTHIQAYARVQDEPALVPPKAVPIPLQRK